MISGKHPNPSSSTGRSYIDVPCRLDFGYSYNQVFKYAGSTGSTDAFLLGHEMGHVFGSKHTHCYLDPTPIDTCYSGETGCYSGATSCPAPQTINGVPNVLGTWLSYCYRLSGCTASKVFHPRTAEIIDPVVQREVGDCIFPSGVPKEASPAAEMRVARGTGSSLVVSYAPACGSSRHTVYAGTLATLPSGIAWTSRFCYLDNSGTLTFDPGPTSSIYFVVVGNNGSVEGSYGLASGGERPAAGPGGLCSYTQTLSGSCP
jgi:hypothetical protein